MGTMILLGVAAFIAGFFTGKIIESKRKKARNASNEMTSSSGGGAR
jgi:hypothetical protein